jgi:hypothetical protein
MKAFKTVKSRTGSLLYTRGSVQKMLDEREEAIEAIAKQLAEKDAALQEAVGHTRLMLGHVGGMTQAVTTWLDQKYPKPAPATEQPGPDAPPAAEPPR